MARRNKVPYAELKLYFGMCSCRSYISEGKFNKKELDIEHIKRKFPNYYGEKYKGLRKEYSNAMKQIIETLNEPTDKTDKNGWTSIRYGLANLLKDEGDAKKLIDYAEKNIKGASGAIELYDYMHGKIRFYRKLRIENITKKDKNRLIEKLNQSGVSPIIHKEDEYSLRTSEELWDRYLKFY